METVERMRAGQEVEKHLPKDVDLKAGRLIPAQVRARGRGLRRVA